MKNPNGRRPANHGGRAVTEAPLYSIGDVAHYLSLPTSTVRSWVTGGKRFRLVVPAAEQQGHVLSFQNLVEIYVLSSLRRKHHVRLAKVRSAIRYMRDQFGTEHPLCDARFFTDGRDVFIKHFEQLISASESGQQGMKEVLDRYLERLEQGPGGVPVRLFPFSSPRLNAPKVVVIDPEVLFGQPCITGTRIPTAVIAERYKAGDSIDELAADYEREGHEIQEVVRYEFRERAA